jgi:uncharacterized glyoxalase superfamily protein PhnB
MTNKCSAIPTGYHSITPYLATTPASKAIEFYKQAFAAKEIMRFEGDVGKIGHAELMIGDSKLMIGDRSGMIQDPFGFVWSIATHIEDLTPDDIQKRAYTEGVRLKKLTVHE